MHQATVVSEEHLADLANELWEEGRLIPSCSGPYHRHTIYFVCDSKAKHTAKFRNGEHPYFALVALTVTPGSTPLTDGGHVIPRFPNGDYVMVVVHRPALRMLQRRTNVLLTGGGIWHDLGPCGSLEFPGGTIEIGETVKVGSLREFLEETGISRIERCQMLRRLDSNALLLSEFMIQVHHCIVDLPEELTVPKYVENDGGITTVRLTHNELLNNYARGLITAGSTLEGLRFVEEMRDPKLREQMFREGALVEETVTFSI